MMSLKRGYNEESLWSSEQPPTKKHCHNLVAPSVEPLHNRPREEFQEKQDPGHLQAPRATSATLEELQAENKLLRQRLAKYQAEIDKKGQSDSTLILKLAKKEHDIGSVTAELREAYKRMQADADDGTQKLLDPTWALIYQAMKKEVEEKNKKIENLQREILGTGFTPYSITGKKLVAKLKALQTENEELGKQLCQGRVEQLQTALAMQKTIVQKLERQVKEADQFVVDLDRENEEMQGTIFALNARLQQYEQKQNDRVDAATQTDKVSGGAIANGKGKARGTEGGRGDK